MSADHFIEVWYAIDGSHNWIGPRIMSTGDVGAYQTRVVQRNFSKGARQVEFKLKDSSPRRCDVLAMAADIG